MSVSVLKQGTYLIATVQAALADSETLGLQEELMAQLNRHRSNGIVVDVTGLDVLDSFAARSLQTLGRIARLRGAVTVIVGIHPDVAFTMVRLGITLNDVHTALDLEGGLALLDRLTRRTHTSGR